MDTITLQDIKLCGAKAIPDDRVVYLVINSKVKVAIVPLKELKMLVEACEELEDMKAIKEEKNELTVGWDEVFLEHERLHPRRQSKS